MLGCKELKGYRLVFDSSTWVYVVDTCILFYFLLFGIKLAVLRHEFEGISEKLELTQSELRLANEQLAEMKLTSEENNTLRVHLEEEEVNKWVIGVRITP